MEKKFDTEKYARLKAELVRDAAKELLELAKENGIAKIYTYLHHDIDKIYAFFFDYDRYDCSIITSTLCEVSQIVFNEDEITIIGQDGYEGYIVGCFWNNVTAAEIIGQIYRFVTTVIANNELQESEKTTGQSL